MILLRDKLQFLLLIFVFSTCFTCCAFPADAGAVAVDNKPRQEIERLVNQVLDILKDPKYKGEAQREKRREKLTNLVNQIFDLNDVSRRVLGRYNRRFTKEQFKEFKDLFSKLLEKIYLAKIEKYSNEKVIFEDEKVLSHNIVAVPTKIIKNNQEIPVEYRLIKRSEKWVGYDVVIEGVSLVKNYRSQFYEILHNKKPEALLKTMRKKVNRLPKNGN